MTTPVEIDHVAVLQAQAHRMREVLADADPQARVPTCPDWSAAELLDHLADVHRFFTRVVDDDPAADAVDALDADRRPLSGDWAEQLADAQDRVAALCRALEEHPPDTRRWMWTADPALHTVGYLRRRMAHEALVHRVDAELAVDAPIAPVAPEVAVDGLDEVLRVFHANRPAWVRAEPTDGGWLAVTAGDVARIWHVRPVTLRGVRPGTAEEVVGDGLEVADGLTGPVAATVTGTAFDLDRWWWNRPADVVVAGDAVLVERIERVRGAGID